MLGHGAKLEEAEPRKKGSEALFGSQVPFMSVYFSSATNRLASSLRASAALMLCFTTEPETWNSWKPLNPEVEETSGSPKLWNTLLTKITCYDTKINSFSTMELQPCEWWVLLRFALHQENDGGGKIWCFLVREVLGGGLWSCELRT